MLEISTLSYYAFAAARDGASSAVVTTIAVLGEKGGSGKTTISVNMAAELASRGQRVLLVDADPQGTAIEWAGIAAEAGHAGPRTIALGDNIRSELGNLASEHDWTIVDLPGRASKRAAAAVMMADLAILPCQPSPADAWALGSTIELLSDARELRPELRVAILMNRTDRTVIGHSTKDAIESLAVPLFETTFGNRTTFREALATGQGVTAYSSSSAAAAEVRKLVEEIHALLQTKRATRKRARG